MFLTESGLDPQLRPQRVAASAVLSAAHADGHTRLKRLYQDGAAKIRLPRVAAGQPLEAVMINTAGGLTGGDRLAWTIDIGARAQAVLTTQACERIYRTAGDCARVECRLSVGVSARLAWLPQETILFDNAALDRRLVADMADGAELLIVEPVVFGRRAMGESVRRGLFRDHWRIHCNNRLIHAEAFAAGPELSQTLARSATADGAAAMATVLLVAPNAEAMAEPARQIVGATAGVSAWTVGGTGKLLARLLAADGYSLRQRLLPLVQLLNGRAALPKVWSL